MLEYVATAIGEIPFAEICELAVVLGRAFNSSSASYVPLLGMPVLLLSLIQGVGSTLSADAVGLPHR